MTDFHRLPETTPQKDTNLATGELITAVILPAAPAGGTKPVTLRWSPWDGEGQAIVDGANKGVELYRKTHPNVTVEFVPQEKSVGK